MSKTLKPFRVVLCVHAPAGFLISSGPKYSNILFVYSYTFEIRGIKNEEILSSKYIANRSIVRLREDFLFFFKNYIKDSISLIKNKIIKTEDLNELYTFIQCLKVNADLFC